MSLAAALAVAALPAVWGYAQIKSLQAELAALRSDQGLRSKDTAALQVEQQRLAQKVQTSVDSTRAALSQLTERAATTDSRLNQHLQQPNQEIENARLVFLNDVKVVGETAKKSCASDMLQAKTVGEATRNSCAEDAKKSTALVESAKKLIEPLQRRFETKSALVDKCAGKLGIPL